MATNEAGQIDMSELFQPGMVVPRKRRLLPFTFSHTEAVIRPALI
jgi:hypothetical protein